jgi:hypothetical protein
MKPRPKITWVAEEEEVSSGLCAYVHTRTEEEVEEEVNDNLQVYDT